MKGRGSLLRQLPETRSPSSMPPLIAKAAPTAMVTAGAGGAGTFPGARRAPYDFLRNLAEKRGVELWSSPAGSLIKVRRGKRSVGLRRGP